METTETRSYYNDSNGISLNVNIGYLAPGHILEGHTVLITGGNKGIGLESAKACAAQGAKVIITARKKEALDDALSEIKAICPEAICAGVLLDITDFDSFERVIAEAEAIYGPIDCLVNNAGISLREGDFLNVTLESWDRQFDTNLKGPFFFTQHWMRRYQALNLHSGRIILIGSDTSGMGNSTPYGLTKNCLASLTVGLAKKCITQGIRINTICPGTTMTDMATYTNGEFCRETTLGNRVLYPREIAETVLFLLSDQSACISGMIIGCTESNICFNNVERELETNP